MSEQQIKTQAFIFKHALCMGVVGVKQVTDWADNLISNSESAEDWLSEIALCKTLNQAVSALGYVPGTAYPEDWWPVLKPQIANALASDKTTPQAVASYCYKLALNGDVPAYDCEALYQFELEYDSIFAGFGTQAEVDAKVLQFLNRSMSYSCLPGRVSQ